MPKSGTKTIDLAYFWSGCASAIKKGLVKNGLEILSIACVFSDGIFRWSYRKLFPKGRADVCRRSRIKNLKAEFLNTYWAWTNAILL